MPNRTFLGHWHLDPDVVFLNHGSFGACPKTVLEAQSELRLQMEREPVRFMARELSDLLDGARHRLANFVRADADGLAFVPNATNGVNAVLRSLDLRPGDQILTTDHAYNAVRRAIVELATRAGADMLVAQIPMPVSSAEIVEEELFRHVTEKTKLVVLDHVTSPSALVLPVERIVASLRARGVETLVDGAHGPGLLDLDLGALGAAYYTGNCHKWLCAPKGAAFLHVRSDVRDRFRPLVVSHGHRPGRPSPSVLHEELDWPGTYDPTPYLSIPRAIEFFETVVPGGWAEVRARNRGMALSARRMLIDRLGLRAPCPEDMVASMVMLMLPDDGGRSSGPFDPLQDLLFDEESIELPVFRWPSPKARMLRFTAQLYNAEEDYRRLADALLKRLPAASER